LCHWLDCDSSQYHLDVSNDPQRWSSANEIAIDSAALDNRPNLLALLAHELSFAQLLEHTELKPDAEDIEGLADLMGVFFGLGIVLAAAAPSDDKPDDAYFEICLSDPMLAYALALFAELRGETKPAWAGQLDGELLEGFYDSQYYLEQSEEEPESASEEYEEADEPDSEEVSELEHASEPNEDLDSNAEAEEIDSDEVAYDREQDEEGNDRTSWDDGEESAELDEDEFAASSADENELRMSAEGNVERPSGLGKQKCPDCGRLKSPESEFCEMCQEHQVDHRAALREELAKHGDTEYLWLQFGLILALAVLALTAFSYL
ncbi:MAG: hypothetical protein AAF394_17900, partial [Planctomycetota bacterium]